MLETVQHPWYLRLADAALQRLEARGVASIPLRPAALKAAAQRRAGLRDLGDPVFEEGLRVLCASAEEQANLSLFGRLMFKKVVTSALTIRLRLVHARRTQPAVFEAPLNRPVIVSGLPRSGTTHLHRMLASTPNTRALRTWELREPIPGAGLDLRRLRTKMVLRHLRRAAPGLDAKHHLHADKAEECVILLDPSMESIGYWMFFPVFDYLDWLKERDPTPAYRDYRSYLQLFQAQTPDRRLVLKAPAHAAHLSALMEAVPEATLIHTHRDPVPVVGSVNSLFHTMLSLASRGFDHERVGRANLDLLAWGTARAMAAREALPPHRAVDVRYQDLVADPVATVTRVGESVGLQVDPAALKARSDQRPQHRFGEHTYHLSEMGLSEDQVRARFAPYIEHYGLGGP